MERFNIIHMGVLEGLTKDLNFLHRITLNLELLIQ